MRNKLLLLPLSLILILGVLGLAFKNQIVRASGTIYIRPDGSIDPPTAPISTFDNVTYILTGNLNDSIVVERNNVVVDGVGYTLQGTGASDSIGMSLSGRSNVTIENMEVKGFLYGIYLYESSNSTIVRNNVTTNNKTPMHNVTDAGHGIRLINSVENSVFENRIRSNWYGIRLINSTYNDISGNYIADNDEGIQLHDSSNNNITGNMLVNDGLTVYGSCENVVDDNWVNGKSLVYIEDVSDRIIEDAGQVILVNCSYITVRNSRLSNTTTGVQLLQTESTEISGNNITANNDLGIQLHDSSNNNITGNYIADNDEGIQLHDSSNNNISGNNITANVWDGIQLYDSSNNNIFSNNLAANNQTGIRLYQSSNNNSIFGNCIANNYEAIQLLWPSADNVIYHNNFVDNLYLYLNPPSIGNFWDDGYPSGGNYWSSYESADLYSGEGQNETGRDGIGDTPYVQDNYPLMGVFVDFVATSEYHVQTICNSSISDFQHNDTALSFTVTGEDDTAGFCRIYIPTTLMNGTYKVFVNGTEVPSALLPSSNTTHTYLYFTYNLSTQEVIIIPELPDWTSMLLLLTGLAVALTVHTRKLLKHQSTEMYTCDT